MIVRLYPYDPVVVEAGTNTGHSALAMIEAGATVFTADPVDRGFRHPDAAFYHGTFEDMLDGIEGWDIAFIDASGPRHDNRLRWKHYQMVRERMDHGVIIVHDTATGGWAGPHTDYEDVLPLILKASTYNLKVGKGLSVTIL